MAMLRVGLMVDSAGKLKIFDTAGSDEVELTKMLNALLATALFRLRGGPFRKKYICFDGARSRCE